MRSARRGSLWLYLIDGIIMITLFGLLISTPTGVFVALDTLADPGLK